MKAFGKEEAGSTAEYKLLRDGQTKSSTVLYRDKNQTKTFPSSSLNILFNFVPSQQQAEEQGSCEGRNITQRLHSGKSRYRFVKSSLKLKEFNVTLKIWVKPLWKLKTLLARMPRKENLNVYLCLFAAKTLDIDVEIYRWRAVKLWRKKTQEMCKALNDPGCVELG